ncbi:MAG: hypothetical protein ACI965_001331 [Paraglaciecola sp.]|jgi:hypothetical protein
MAVDYAKAPRQLLRAQKIAHLSDSALPIPFTGKGVGLDFIIGLIPGAGDLVMLGVSGYIIWLAKSLGVPGPLRRVMLRRCLIDFALGLLPIVGDIVDVFYQANKANVRIMERFWLAQHKSALDASVSQTLARWEKEQN